MNELPDNFHIEEFDAAIAENPDEIPHDVRYMGGISALQSINSIAKGALPLFAVCRDAEGIAFLQDIASNQDNCALLPNVQLVTELPKVSDMPAAYHLVNLTAYF